MQIDEPMPYPDLIERIKNIRSENLIINAESLYRNYELLYLYLQKPEEKHKKKIEAVLAAGHHGNEQAGVEALVQFVEENKDNDLLFDKYNFTIFPLINPWGYNFSCNNYLGISINGDYVDRRTPEAKIVFNVLLQKNEYDLALDLHSTLESNGFLLFVSSKRYDCLQRIKFAGHILAKLKKDGVVLSKEHALITHKKELSEPTFECLLYNFGALSFTFEANMADSFDKQVFIHKKAVGITLEKYLSESKK